MTVVIFRFIKSRKCVIYLLKFILQQGFPELLLLCVFFSHLPVVCASCSQPFMKCHRSMQITSDDILLISIAHVFFYAMLQLHVMKIHCR